MLVLSVLHMSSIDMLLDANLTLNYLNHCLVCGAPNQSRTIIRVKAVVLIYRTLALAAVIDCGHKDLIMTEKICMTHEGNAQCSTHLSRNVAIDWMNG